MAGQVITAEARILGVDQTGGAFASVQGKIDKLIAKFGQVGKAAAVSAQIDKLNASLKKTQDQLAGVQKLQTAEDKLARLATRNAQQKAIAEEAASARTAAAAQRAAAAYYKQLDAVSALRRSLEGAGVGVNSLASEEARLRHAIDGTTGAIGRQNRALVQAAEREATLAHRQDRLRHGARETGRHIAGSALGMAGGVGAGYAAIRGSEIAAEKAGEFQAVLNRVRNVSNSEDEVALAAQIATKASAANPYTTRTQSVEDYVELRSLAVSNKPGEAINREAIERNVLLMARARAALASSGYQLEGGEAKSLAQAIEGSGRALDPQAQTKMLDAFVRAKQVFGNAIQASDVRAFVQNAKSANFSISDESFFNTIMARLAQGNSSRLGNEFSQTMQTIVGGHMTAAGANWLAKVGMIEPGQIRKGGGGKFYIAGKIKDQDLLSTDVTAWAQQVLYPGIQKTGAINSHAIEARTRMLREQELRANPKAQVDMHALEERAIHGLVADFIAKSGFRTTVTDNLAHAIANAYQTQKDVEQMKGAKGLGAAETIGQNPVASFGELGSAISSLVAAAGSPAAAKAGEMLHAMAGGVSALASAAAEHPNIATTTAAGAGLLGLGIAGGGAYLTYQWLAAGAHLSASATALDASAAALTEAAGVLAGKSVLPEVGGAAAAGAGAVALKALRYGGGIGAFIATMWPTTLGDGEATGEQRTYWRDQIEKRRGATTLLPGDAPSAPTPPPPPIHKDIDILSRIRSAFGGDAVPTYGRGDLIGGPQGPTLLSHGDLDLGAKIRASLEGLKATVQDPIKVDPVELKGSADVRVTVQVNGDGKVTGEFASSSGHIRASVGASMPSLAPGHPPPT